MAKGKKQKRAEPAPAVRLTAKQWKAFVAALDDPPPPNDKLKALLRSRISFR